MLADRVVAEPELLHECLVYDRNGRTCPVRSAEIPAGKQRYRERFEEPRAHLVVRVGVRVRGQVHAVDARDIRAQSEVAEDRDRARPDAVNPGLGGERGLDAIVDRVERVGRVTGEQRRDAEARDRLHGHPEIEARDVDQAAREQSREHEQDRSERNLRGDQRTVEARDASSAARLGALALDDRREIRVTRLDRGRKAEDQQGRERCRATEHERGHAERYRQVGREREGRDEAQRHGRDRHARERAEQRERRRLGEQLRREPAAARADGGPDRELAGARRAAREQQIRDVHADDQ